MRQAYDYWQDQPGSCLSRDREPTAGEGRRPKAPVPIVETKGVFQALALCSEVAPIPVDRKTEGRSCFDAPTERFSRLWTNDTERSVGTNVRKPRHTPRSPSVISTRTPAFPQAKPRCRLAANECPRALSKRQSRLPLEHKFSHRVPIQARSQQQSSEARKRLRPSNGGRSPGGKR